MAMPAKPVELKRKLGNPGQRPLPEPRAVEPGSVHDVPTPPRKLSKLARTIWDRYWIAGAGWLSPRTDLEIVTRLCEAYDERAALRKLLVGGLTVTGSTGQTVMHPAISAIRTLEGMITRYENLCGFTPSDRTRLGIAEVTRQSKLQEFLQSQR